MAIEILTPRLKLRPINERDIPYLVKHLNNPKVSGFLVDVPHPFKEEDAKEWIRYCGSERSILNFGIDRDKFGLIGEIGLNPINMRRGHGELVYWVSEDHWGQGIATEALKSIISYSFEVLGLNSLRLDAFTENDGSNSIAKKFNFKHIAIIKEELPILSERKLKKEHVYMLYKKDYKNLTLFN
jgi:[ribosomal protein S5]-alanine N-acetyltransferase